MFGSTGTYSKNKTSGRLVSSLTTPVLQRILDFGVSDAMTICPVEMKEMTNLSLSIMIGKRMLHQFLCFQVKEVKVCLAYKITSDTPYGLCI